MVENEGRTVLESVGKLEGLKVRRLKSRDP